MEKCPFLPAAAPKNNQPVPTPPGEHGLFFATLARFLSDCSQYLCIFVNSSLPSSSPKAPSSPLLPDHKARSPQGSTPRGPQAILRAAEGLPLRLSHSFTTERF